METDTGTEEEIREILEEKQHDEEEAVKEKKTEPNMFQRVKNRFSTRSKKLDKDVNLEKTNEKVKNEKELNEDGLGDVELRKNTNGEIKETITIKSKSNDEGNKEEKTENAVAKKDESLEDKNNPKKEANVFVRVKERLSKRSKKKKTDNKNNQHEKELDEITRKENEIKKETKPESEVESGETDVFKVEKKDTKKEVEEENIFQKLLRRLSFRSKKKKKTLAPEKGADTECDNEEKKEVDKNEDDTKSLSSVDEELSALCKDNTEETQGTSPSVPIVNSSRPPLPSIRRPPSSATTAQSRPVSQLDAALKQFRLSTAASRENLRSSKVDISQVEEQVKTMVTSRPSTPTPAGWRSRAPAENKNLTDQWAKLSSSMTDLR